MQSDCFCCLIELNPAMGRNVIVTNETGMNVDHHLFLGADDSGYLTAASQCPILTDVSSFLSS